VGNTTGTLQRWLDQAVLATSADVKTRTGLISDSAACERILHERDLATVAWWLVHATTCADAAALLDEPAA